MMSDESPVDFSLEELPESRWTGDLRGHRYNDTQLAAAKFIGADLRGCSFDGAQLAGSVFLDCDLRQTTWLGANWCDIVFQRCRFTHGWISSLTDMLTIGGLNWPILIGRVDDSEDGDHLMAIGCQVRTLREWQALDRRAQLLIDGRDGARWWQLFGGPLIAVAKAHLHGARNRS